MYNYHYYYYLQIQFLTLPEAGVFKQQDTAP
jgi:hypothetical protein